MDRKYGKEIWKGNMDRKYGQEIWTGNIGKVIWVGKPVGNLIGNLDRNKG